MKIKRGTDLRTQLFFLRFDGAAQRQAIKLEGLPLLTLISSSVTFFLLMRLKA
eukprot:c14707_g1_i1 orf=77-235(-)